MMRCESAAAQGLRSDKTATKRRALEPDSPLPSTPGWRVADLHPLPASVAPSGCAALNMTPLAMTIT